MKVKDVMTEDVQSVSVPGNRDEAMKLIRKAKVSALPVVKEDSEKLVGIVRLRDLFENPDENQLGMLVNRDIYTISPEKSLEEAARNMLEKNIRRLPVMDGGDLLGIVTVQDLLFKALAEREEETPASDCMQNSVTSLWQSTPLNVALEILNLSGERALPVIDDDGKLVGILGDGDIIEVSSVEMEERKGQMAGGGETDKWTWDSEDRIYITKRSLTPPDKTVAEVMAKDVITVSKRTAASKCANLMKNNDINQLPVITSGKKLLGMVSDEDLLRALTE